MTFRGEVNFDGGCEIDGLVDFRNADFESELNLGDTVLRASGDRCLDMTSAVVAGNLRLGRRQRSIRLTNATVGGSVLGVGTVIESSDESSDAAVAARGIRVGGDVYLNDASVTGGALDLRRSTIAGDLSLRGGTIEHPGGQTLALTYGRVEGSIYLDGGLRSNGNVRLNRSFIGGRLVCDGGTFLSDEPAGDPLSAFEAILATASGGAYLKWDAVGAVNLTGASTTVLGDDPTGWGASYELGGMRYDRLSHRDLPASADTASRISWLLGQKRADASSFDQLADYYRRHGRTVDAERVLIVRNRALRHERAEQGGWRNRVRNGIDRFWDVSVGYGFRAARAGALLLGLVVATAVVLALPAATDAMRATDQSDRVYSPAGALGAAGGVGIEASDDDACGGGRIRCFSPTFYAIDTVIPLVDLHQRSTWYPDRNAPNGAFYEWWLDLAVLLGWVTTSVLVLGLTHAIGPSRH